MISLEQFPFLGKYLIGRYRCVTALSACCQVDPKELYQVITPALWLSVLFHICFCIYS